MVADDAADLAAAVHGEAVAVIHHAKGRARDACDAIFRASIAASSITFETIDESAIVQIRIFPIQQGGVEWTAIAEKK